MSHVVNMQLSVDDLGSLQEAAKTLGLELVKGQTSYKWFGRFMGDAPLPEGFTKEDLGKCNHVIRLPGNDKAYEIGVVKNKSGSGFSLLFDFWAGGYGLEKAIGKDGGLLKQSYSVIRAKKEMLRKGHRVSTTKDAKGNMFLEFTT
jgi:hypothetical protein